MPLDTPAYPTKFVRSAEWIPTAVDFVPISLSIDVDLTDPAGPTGGYCARAVQIGDTGGDLVVITLQGDERTIPVAANALVQVAVAVVGGTSSGTTATPVGVYL